MVEATEHRLDRLEGDVKEVKDTLTTIAEHVTVHVTKCEERKDRSDKWIKWIIGAVIVWFGGVEGHEEVISLASKFFGV